MIIVNHAESPYNSIKIFSELLSRNLDISLKNINTKHYYIDSITNMTKINDIVIQSHLYEYIYGDKTITYIHDIFPIIYDATLFQKTLINIKILQLKLYNSFIVFNSNHTKYQFIQHFPNFKDFVVIYPYIHPAYKPLNLDRSDYILIDFAHSSGETRKNIKGYEQYIETHPNEHFIKIGSKFAKNYENVEYKQNVSFEELNYLYNKASKLLWLSFDEGFGSPLAQAMMTKTPVETFETEINRELLGNIKLENNMLLDVESAYKQINDIVNTRLLNNEWNYILNMIESRR